MAGTAKLILAQHGSYHNVCLTWTCMQQEKSLSQTLTMLERVRRHVGYFDMTRCWAQSEAGAGPAGQVAWAGQPQRAAVLPPVRSLLQQAGGCREKRHHKAGAALLRHASVVLCRQEISSTAVPLTFPTFVWPSGRCLLRHAGSCCAE